MTNSLLKHHLSLNSSCGLKSLFRVQSCCGVLVVSFEVSGSSSSFRTHSKLRFNSGLTLIDSPKIPLVLLPYAVLIFITTGACMYEISFWDVPLQQKLDLSTLYGPYLAICMFRAMRPFYSLVTDKSEAMFMTVDMYIRLNDTVNKASAASIVGKKRQ
jgi:hypothetical protein